MNVAHAGAGRALGIGSLAALGCAVLAMAPQDASHFPRIDAQPDVLISELRSYSTQVIELPADDGPVLRPRVKLGDHEVTLDLHPHSLRAEDFRLLVQGVDGRITEVEPPATITYRGTLAGEPGSRVSAAVFEGRLWATIQVDEPTTWYVQPLSDFRDDSPPGWHAVYRGDQVLGDDEFRCGFDERKQAPAAMAGGRSATPRSGGPGVCEIAFDCDVEYFDLNGSSVSDTLLDVERVMNDVELVYQRDTQIAYEITVLLVRTAEPDPYPSTNNEALLNDFRSEWNANFRDVRRDVAHLMTGKDIDGSVIGTAYLGVICDDLVNGRGYGFSQSRFSAAMRSRVALTAHELGHNWNALHCNADGFSCKIMCSSLGGCGGIGWPTPRFGPTSIGVITAFRNTRSCLDEAVEPLTLPFFDAFPGPTLDPSRWTFNNGAALSADAVAPPSPPFALQLNAAGPGAFQDDELRSNVIRLGGSGGATLSFYTQHRGVDAGEALVAEYWSGGLRWSEIARIVSDGSDQTSFARHTTLLSSDALHDGFRLRFRAEVDQPEDSWFVDDVALDVRRFDVAIGSAPATSIPIAVLPPDGQGRTDGLTPFTRNYEAGTTVTLSAPAQIGTLEFSGWRLDGQPQGTGSTLVFTVSAARGAEAEYVPAYTLAVLSRPVDGAMIGVAPPDRANLGDGATPFTRSYLSGEHVVLTAPAEHAGRAFSHWSVNGVNQLGLDPVVEVAMDVDAFAVAHYTTFAPGASATLTVGSLPVRGVPIPVLPPPGGAPGSAPSNPDFLGVYPIGQTVTLVAPQRTERLVFARWWVDGVAQAEEQADLVHRLEHDAVLTAEYELLGDMNGDDLLNDRDVEAFIVALSDPKLYARRYPGLARVRRGDINGDGVLDNFDIDPFVQRLLPAK